MYTRIRVPRAVKRRLYSRTIDIFSSCKVIGESEVPESKMAKVITVFGATGAQGGPIARALLTTAGFKVRAVTRNPDSEKAKALKEAGAEVVKADMSDVSSVDAALQGAYGAFVNTNYWELIKQATPEAAFAEEIQQGKSLADAAIRAGLKHYVYSSLDPVKDKIGKVCPHFDTKAEVEKYIVTCGVPYSIVRYPFYFDNFADVMAPQKQEDGTFSITLPMDGPMHGLGLSNAGPILATIFSNPKEYLGKAVKMAGDRITMSEYAAIISRVTGKTVKYNQVPVEVFANFPFPVAREMATMFEYYSIGHPEYNVELTRKINPNTQTFEQWAEQNKVALLKVLS